MRPAETKVYLSSSVVDQLHRPSSFVLDPDKNTSLHVTGGQLLKGLVPAHQDHLQRQSGVEMLTDALLTTTMENREQLPHPSDRKTRIKT